MDNKEKFDNFLPSQSILLKPDKNIRNNYFESTIFFEEIMPKEEKEKQKEKENKEEKKLLRELEDILICCICYNYLEDPVNDPTSCPHYSCRNCLEKYFNQKKTNIVPCPICRRRIKKMSLVNIPIFESIKEILKDAKNSKVNKEDKEIISEKCEVHPKNPVFYICLDCKKKMCPICNEEKKKHETHHLANYSRYVELFNFFHENFADIKQTIFEQEKNIKDYNELIGILQIQKNSYLDFLKTISAKIEKIYSEKEENLKKQIAFSMQKMAKLRYFMINTKSYVSASFAESYNDIENLDVIKENIKERIDQLNLKSQKNNNLNIKYYLHLPEIRNNVYQINFIKQEFIENGHISCKLGKEEHRISSFGMELSKDKKFINIYLDIFKNIQGKLNNNKYLAFISYDNKLLDLEPKEVIKDMYSFEKTVPFEEICSGKEGNIILNLSLLFSNFN